MGHICRFKQTTIDNRASVKRESPSFVLGLVPLIRLLSYVMIGMEVLNIDWLRAIKLI